MSIDPHSLIMESDTTQTNTSMTTPEAIDGDLINCSKFDQSPTNVSYDPQREHLMRVSHYLYNIIVPAVCVFGFLGNILNIAVFTKKKTCKTLDKIEQCTTMCLVALAVSDMMFCVCTFPLAFQTNYTPIYNPGFLMYYKMYSAAIINTFILSSTMLTTMTAIMRYMAICHPFHSRQIIGYRKTIICVLSLGLFSFVFNIPHLWLYYQKEVPCMDGSTKGFKVILEYGSLFKNEKFWYSFKLLWTIIGNFIPLAILLYCNIRLVRALHQSQQLRLLHSRDNTGCLSAHKRVNITLITIIIFFFILVAPSEITKFIMLVSKPADKYTFRLVSMVTNTMQAFNFSVNFILYYIIIAPFRKTIHEFVCIMKNGGRTTRTSSNSPRERQTCMLLVVKDHRKQEFM